MRFLTITIVLFCVLQSHSQTDFNAFKERYIDYRKSSLQDSALLVARKMNKSALAEQGDTSYWYALSMRYLGNPYYSKGNIDSALYFWEISAELFKKNHPEHPDYASSLNNLGSLYSGIYDYKKAEEYFLEAMKIYKKALG